MPLFTVPTPDPGYTALTMWCHGPWPSPGLPQSLPLIHLHPALAAPGWIGKGCEESLGFPQFRNGTCHLEIFMAHASLRGILYSCEESHFRRNDLENADDKNFQISLKNDNNYYKEVNVYL